MKFILTILLDLIYNIRCTIVVRWLYYILF